ncbi:MAG: cytoplasmic protein [Blastocatellia bacterium]
MNTQNTAAAVSVAEVPENYRVLLENSRVRILEHRCLPGEITDMHSHPDSVVYSFSPAALLVTTAYESSEQIELRAGEVMYRTATRHALQNIGSTEAHLLVIELKEPAAGEISQHRSEGGYFPLT